MAKTFLDELAEYPAQVIRAFGTNQTIVGLLADDPTIDVESDKADEVFDKYLFDFNYVDSTTTEARAYVCVEAEVHNYSSPTILDFRLYVTILCHKQFMNIDAKRFTGMIGNRRDNLARYIDRVLNGSEVFGGIGRLTLESVKTVDVPPGFTARELTYRVSDFRNRA